MAKKLVTSYTFTPGAANAGTVVVSGTYALEQFLLITNVTTGATVYQFNKSTKGGSVVVSGGNTTLTLEADTSAMSAGDRLQVFVDDGQNAQVLLANASVEISNDVGSPVPVSGPLTDTQLRASALPVSASALPLPTGAATGVKQDTANSSLSSIDGKLPALSSGRVPVDVGSSINVGEVEIKNDTGNPVPVSGPLTDTQLRASNVGVAPNISRGSGVMDANTTRVTLATDGPTVTALSSIDTKTPALVNGRQPVDGSGVTQPISAVNLPLPAGAATQTTLANIDNRLGAGVGVLPQSFTTIFREVFKSFTPGTNWTLSTGSGDLVQLDGNAVAASYLVISKDPLSTGTETTLTSTGTYTMPFDTAVGLSMSQRVLGQELSMEMVSTDTPLSSISDIAISSISQATTTLTVNTATAHGLVPGMRIGIYGVSDSRLNYPSLVVATIPSTTQFTCTAGPGGTIASVTAGPFTSGNVYVRPALGYARDGVSEIFENATTTNSSIYHRADGGDALPSGTATTSHTVTCATTTATQAANAAFTYAFLPASEYRLVLQEDRAQVLDTAVDSSSVASNRVIRTQVTPDPNKSYRLRFRVTNTKGLTVPTAKIVSATKSGSTTATITTSAAHGLTTGDFIIIYGIRDQTNFANLTTATQVVSTPTSTTFTIAFGASATATSYGGMVARVQGGNIPAAFTTMAVQSAANDGSLLTLVGSANWTQLIGDYVNVYGCRDNTTGADLGVDGVYRVANVFTTTLVLQPIGSTTLPAVFTTTNAGGTVIKRTDVRLGYVRIADYLRHRIEAQPTASSATALPAYITGFATGIAFQTDQTISLRPSAIINDVASAALTSTTTTSAVTPALGSAYQVNIPVTAVSGTTPTLDVSIEESDDSGTNWFKVYDFPRITATGMYRSPIIRMVGNRVRYVQTVGGTSPSFTRAINRLQTNTNSEPIRQLIDRTIVLTTLNSTTPSLDTRDCGNRVQLVINVGAITTTAPALQLEGSDDNGASWYAIGSPLTAVASSTVQATTVNLNSALVRARVSTAGSGVTAGYIMIKAHD